MTLLFQRWLRANPGQGLAAAFGELEVRVLESLWRRATPSSVRAVREDYPQAAYTTLMTTLDRLYRKGVLDRERAGRAFLYRPRYARSEIEGLLAANALDALLHHEPSALRPALSFLVDAFGTRDQRLLDELEELVRERRGREERKPVDFHFLGVLGLLAAFGIGSLAGSAIVLAAWRLLGRRIASLPATSRARALFALRLFPTAVGLLASVGLLLPAYLVLEPRRAGEIPGVTFWACALAGLAIACRGGWRLAATLVATDRVVRGWSKDAKPVVLEGVGCPVYRFESAAPIVALAGTRKPKLFIASSVLDGCAPDLVSAMAAHEVGHWHSGDNVKRLMLEGAADPLPLFSSGRRMLEEWESASEESADDHAIAGGANPEALAESLVRVARLASRAPVPVAAVAAAFYRGEAFEKRVRRLLAAPARLARRASGLGRTGGLLILLAAAGGLAATPGVLEPLHQIFEVIVHAP